VVDKVRKVEKIDNILFLVYYGVITNSHKFSPSMFYTEAKALI